MLYSSAEAAKLLRTINEEIAALKDKEGKSYTFVASVNEDLESARPLYVYDDMQDKLIEMDEKVRKIKHAMNVFNTTTMVPGFDMTIDQMLVYIPQLNERKRKLSMFAARLPKTRLGASGFNGGAAVIEYQYANYDVSKAEEDLQKVTEELSNAQTALDLVNNTEKFEIEL